MSDWLTSLRLTVASMLVCCVGYPAVLLAFGRGVMPERAGGSLIRDADGVIRGSALIAQGYSEARYFWPRPSAAGYAANAAGGSNLSPANPALGVTAGEIISRLGPAPDERVPADLVSASGSGLDPHISAAAARFQAARVAAQRGISVEHVEGLIDANLEATTMRIFGGQPVVNVLRLNLALDSLPSRE